MLGCRRCGAHTTSGYCHVCKSMREDICNGCAAAFTTVFAPLSALCADIAKRHELTDRLAHYQIAIVTFHTSPNKLNNDVQSP
jgi:hypothetical protein